MMVSCSNASFSRGLVVLMIMMMCELIGVAGFPSSFKATRTCSRPNGSPYCSFSIATDDKRLLSKSAKRANNNDNDQPEAESKTKNAQTETPISFLEGAVQSITGDKSYKFGDYTKKTVSDLTGKDVNKEGYEFGDISKNFVAKAGKAVTGKDDYEFGDITRGALTEMENSLQDWQGQAFNDLPSQALQQLFRNVDKSQRRALILAAIRLLAIALLSWGFVANLCTSAIITSSWISASLATATRGCWNPFRVSALQRQLFLTTYSFSRIVLDPFCLLVQGAGTLGIFVRYQKFVATIEQNWIGQKQRVRHPLLYRVASLGLAFLSNLGVAIVITGCGVFLGTLAGQWKLIVYPK
jgi:hypothetical protein